MLLRFTLDKKGSHEVWEQKIIITGNVKIYTVTGDMTFGKAAAKPKVMWHRFRN
jgi:hypothetical protein